MDTIITKFRNLSSDLSESVSDIFTYSTSSVFTLTESNPISVTTVYKNDVSTALYTYSSTTKKVTLSISLTAGDTVQIDYSCYRNYSDAEIRGYITSALYYLGIYGFENYEVESGNEIYPIPTLEEEKLIAVIAYILADNSIRSIRLPNISINTTDTLSKEQKIDKVIKSFKRNTGIFTLI